MSAREPVMTQQLYAISLWQPWASLIFASWFGDGTRRFKIHETRSWAPSERGVIKRGQRLVIHAAKTTRGYREQSDDLHAMCFRHFGVDYQRTLPRGEGLGCVTLGDWFPADPARAAHEGDLEAGGWGEGRFAWRLDDAELYEERRPMKGRQGFWRVD